MLDYFMFTISFYKTNKITQTCFQGKADKAKLKKHIPLLMFIVYNIIQGYTPNLSFN